ncbi:hypothetical protein KJK29_21830 [Streptomyces koelreuteriae]|uniref:Apea-like HEPN domain-containing protein n=1 Tax=Streptomyces koelreuteriae TaxID=2838015 RepID=A0ABX8FUX1_9ACTN|nr:HEPN domain-containing protein [Streptomyces koelreuteriae]QWB25003.1 hypothetical protein KJK29_21830 [Streptomyces koelreuteriae]UUA08029.1 HEPN domain-containing protein [Streptomyces koelreuteriae]
MASGPTPVDLNLWEASKRLTEDAIAALKARKESGGHISPHLNYPRLRTLDNGMPSITPTFNSGPPHYDFALFQDFRKDGVAEYEEWESYQAYITHARSSEKVMEYYNPNYREASKDELTDRILAFLPFELADRYLSTTGSNAGDIDEESLLSIYLELEAPIFTHNLPVPAVIPLALTPMDIDQLDLLPNVRVERLSNEEQLARSVSDYGDSNVAMNKWVVHAATHALVVDNLNISHQHRWDFDYLPIRADVTDLADDFVRAIAISMRRDTGYAQIYYRPQGWARDFTANLPAVVGVSFLRRYPPKFDHSWRNDVPSLTLEECQSVAETFKSLRACETRIKLAARRLGMGLFRETEEDSILDYCIGLEAVFGDLGPGETTYKLAMRGAKVLSSQLAISESEAFTCFKKIYAYRSAVAHGKGNTEKLQIIKLRDDLEVSAEVAAKEFLRMGLTAALKDPRLTVEYIDRNLLLSSEINQDPDVSQ